MDLSQLRREHLQARKPTNDSEAQRVLAPLVYHPLLFRDRAYQRHTPVLPDSEEHALPVGLSVLAVNHQGQILICVVHSQTRRVLAAVLRRRKAHADREL